MPPYARSLVVLVALTASACSLFRLRTDEAAKAEAGIVTGSIATPSGTTENVLVALFRVPAGGAVLEGYDELSSLVRSFAFVVKVGTPYVLVAFCDLNRNRRWDPGEPVARVEGGRTLTVEPRKVRIVSETALGSGGEPGGYDLDLSRLPAAKGNVPLALGEVTTLDDPRFDPARGEEGMWTSGAALQTAGYGLYLLEPYDPGCVPVVFVHGIGGTPRDFRSVIGALDRARFQPWVFHYPSGLRLAPTAEVLGRALDRLHTSLAVDSVVITAHSMGGLVARGAILWLDSHAGGAGFVSTLVTFSTPWLGHEAAASGVKWMSSPVPAWIDMAPGSDYLRSLRLPLPRGIDFYLLFGFGGGRSLLMGEANDGVVTVASELAPFAQEEATHAWGYDLDHMAILSDGAPLTRYAAILASTTGGGAPPAR